MRPLRPEDVEAALDAAAGDGVESLAISLLFSYLNPAHEALIAAAARRRGLWVSVSSELVPEYREYERASTTVVNAFLAPVGAPAKIAAAGDAGRDLFMGANDRARCALELQPGEIARPAPHQRLGEGQELQFSPAPL